MSLLNPETIHTEAVQRVAVMRVAHSQRLGEEQRILFDRECEERRIATETETNIGLIRNLIGELPVFSTKDVSGDSPVNFFELPVDFRSARRIQTAAVWLGNVALPRAGLVARTPFYVIGSSENTLLMTPAMNGSNSIYPGEQTMGYFGLSRRRSRSRYVCLPNLLEVDFEPEEKQKLDGLDSGVDTPFTIKEVDEAYSPSNDGLIISARNQGSFVVTKTLRDYSKPLSSQALCTAVRSPEHLTDETMRSMEVLDHLSALYAHFGLETRLPALSRHYIRINQQI